MRALVIALALLLALCGCGRTALAPDCPQAVIFDELPAACRPPVKKTWETQRGRGDQQ